jgi:AraC-like DNA-binding protein
MKVLPFTIPTSHDKTILVQEDIEQYFYPHLHRHEEIQLTLVLKGEGTLLVGNNMHAFGPNEIYLIGANLPHVFKSNASYFAPNSKGEVHALSIFFSTNGKLMSLFDLPELKNVYSFFSSNYSGFKVPQQAFSDISIRILNMKYASGMDQLMQFFHLLKSLSNLEDINPLAPESQPKTFSDYEGERISKIYNYILQHYHRDITPPAFCRYFKKHTRVTFVTFLNEVRINEARKKLVDGSYDCISSVAYDCGFNSITNFNRVFKSTTGKSPREYASVYLSNVN